MKERAVTHFKSNLLMINAMYNMSTLQLMQLKRVN
jgi:hypothetical protein